MTFPPPLLPPDERPRLFGATACHFVADRDRGRTKRVCEGRLVPGEVTIGRNDPWASRLRGLSVRAMKLAPEEKRLSKEERDAVKETTTGTMTTTEVTAAASPPPSPASERMTTASMASPSRDSSASSPPAAPVKQASSDFSVNSLLTSKE